MAKLNIAMYSVIRAESAMTIRPLQYALQMHWVKQSHNVGLTSYRLASISFHVNRSAHS